MTIEEELNAMNDYIEPKEEGVKDASTEDDELNPEQESGDLGQPGEDSGELDAGPDSSGEDSGELPDEAGGDLGGEGESPKPTARELELHRQIEELKAKMRDKDKPETNKFELDDRDFLEGEAEEDLSELDSKKLNQLLNKAYKAAAEKSFERVMVSLPSIIKTNLTQQTALTNAANNFYSSNPDLAPYKQAVSNIAEEIISKNPDLNLEELFKEVEKESRKRLSLAKKAVGKGGSKPAVMRKPNVGKPGVKGVQHPLQQEIDAMNQIDI